MPSTFRHTAGEMADNDDELYRVVKPRRAGKVVALLGVVAAASFAAYYYVQQRSAEQPPPSAAIERQPPAQPKKIRLSVKSDPPGASVLRRDSNEQLGITPFDIELPTGGTPIELVFKKEAYRDKVESFVPEESGQIAVPLVASAPPEKPAAAPAAPAAEPAPSAEAAPGAKAARAARTASKPAPAARRRSGGARRVPRSLDEDGVLAPSF
jgi:hypothetical protein